jgi:hypothetical protein
VSRVILGLLVWISFSSVFAAADKLPFECLKVYAGDEPIAGEFSKATMRFNEDESQVLIDFTKEDQLKPSLFFSIPTDYFNTHAATFKGIEISLGNDKKVKIYRLSFRMKKQAQFDYHGILITDLSNLKNSLICDVEGKKIQ